MFKKFLDKAKEVVGEIMKDFNFNDENPETDPHKLWLLNLAGPLANHNWAYVNSLTTGLEKSEILEGIANSWGIDSRDSAIETISWLRDSGHRYFYDILVDSIKTGVVPSTDDKERMDEYSKNFHESKVLLKMQYKIGQEEIDRGILAWDIGRFAYLVRCCFDAEIISEAEAWDLLNAVKEPVQGIYSNWKDYWNGFMLGRAMWNGVQASGFEEISDEGDKFLDKDNGPFKTVPWNL